MAKWMGRFIHIGKFASLFETSSLVGAMKPFAVSPDQVSEG
jgi:hypothetical protein